ncbi:DUF7144 family membrane protein [Actinocorallia populi]|uniref:DUF7144 family membrane protein n=1 Tax=Actinocorallia populi TaxID=2079200 RepID=UPI000D08D0C9|nr:hypothetical protein [Actinocorallia populi]
MNGQMSGRQAAASGVVLFVSVLMVMNGIWGVIVGIAAIARREFFVLAPNYVYEFSTTGWGWIHLILGVLLVAIALALMSGKRWARWPAVALAVLQAIDHFFFIPYYPWWSILVIVLDIVIIWALLVYRPEDF